MVLLAALLLAQAAAGSRLNLALPQEPRSLDPATATSGSAWLVLDQIYETLFRVTPSGEVVGRLAADWTYASSTRLRVRLVKGVTFSDGAAVDAAAVQASIARLLEPDGPGEHPLAAAVTAVEVHDPTTVVFVTPEPFAPLPALLAHPSTAIVPGGFGRDLRRSPVGSGPYELLEWADSEYLLLGRNPHFRGEEPVLTELRFEFASSGDAVAQRLAEGRLDLAWFFQPGAPAALDDSPGLTVRTVVAPSTAVLGLNSANPALSDLNVRQAIALAIDKLSLVHGVLGGAAVPAVVPLPPSVRMAPTSFEEAYPYEPEAARALLEGEGLPSVDLTLDLQEDPELEAVAEALRLMLADVGIELEVRVLSPAQYLARLESRDLQLFLTRWESRGLDPDPTLFRGLHSSAIPQGNASRYRVAAVDSLLREARNSTSEVVRAADYLDVLEAVLTDLPVIALYHPTYTVVKSAALQGERSGPAWYLLDLSSATLAR